MIARCMYCGYQGEDRHRVGVVEVLLVLNIIMTLLHVKVEGVLGGHQKAR